MNLNHEQQILIKDIFNVTVDHNNPGAAYLLQQFPKQIAQLGQNVSLIKHNTYFDSLIMERLQVSGTDIMAYLQECLQKCHYVIQKPWNQNDTSQKFIKYSIQIITNFVFLTLQDPQIFPQQQQIDTQATKVQDNNKLLSIAMRVLTHFQRKGFNLQLLNIIYPRINNQIQGNFPEMFLQVLIARQRFQTISQNKSFFYLNLLSDLLNIVDFRIQFFKMSKYPFTPTTIQKLKGSMIDTQSPFGLFARTSVLGILPGFFHQEKQINNIFQQRMIKELGQDKLSRDKIKYYADLQNQYYQKLTSLYKLFFKKETQKQFLEWNYGVIFGNLKKAKLGSRVQGAKNADLSHDGFTLNAFSCLLNLCKPFLTKQNDTYKKIDPNYLIYKQRFLACKYDPLNQKQKKGSPMELQKEFGTISQFFFMCMEMLNIGIVAAQDTFIELNQYKQKLDKQKPKIPPNHPLFKKLQFQISHTQSKMVRYFVLLLDDRLILSTTKLLEMMMHLLPRWIGVQYQTMKHGKIPGYKVNELAYYIPQHFLQSICKFHLSNFKFKQNYLQLIGQEHISDILNLSCLLLSKQQIASNPYLAANFVQLIFYFLQQKKLGIMYQVFKNNYVAHYNLTNGLIHFYCDIAVTGSSHAFYQKFKYRFYVNKIFSSLWAHQTYRFNLKSYFQEPVFEKFLNMMMTDLTYCFDEVNESYSKYKSLEDKKQLGPLSEQDQKSEQQISMVMGSTLSQSTSNLKLMRQLSAWSPQTFVSQAQISTVVPLLNNILKTFVDPTTFVMNRQLITKYRFQKQIALSDLLQIYVQLDINDRLSNEIIKDARSYKKQYFSKALQKASNQHYTGIQTLEKFENLINKLSTAVNEEQDEQIYGQIPEKYLCALMSTLMKDPVLLPGSGNIVDRITIHRHLLTDERDPFTRAPLKESEVKQMKDLKAEIQNWKKKRLAQLKIGGKQVKYGNIQNAKKQQDDQDIQKQEILDFEQGEQN